MKKNALTLSVFIILFAIYWGFSDMKPSLNSSSNNSKIAFSLNNALAHLQRITQKTHYVGSKEHKTVQNYIVTELKKMGLQPEVQIQTAINKKWYAATTTENIITTIKGSRNGKSLLLLTHYDSSPHSSLGASDAGSGVVTILEGIRTFLAKNKQAKNDIIIVFSDAEEIGLVGAKAFVNYHPLAKNIGLVLNFEARGSGGPSYMLMETNGKNSKLLTEFINAKPNYPITNSLMYSVYKMLPNDTDLTVFREDANINGFNFAFIGDHFDYHTAQDSYSRLDRETLLHQADYLTTMLNYFADANLNNLNSDKDNVYVNFPMIKIIHYPFTWILPMLLFAIFIFLAVLFLGLKRNKLSLKGIAKGFIAFIFSLVIAVGISFGLWKLLLLIHPQYQDILHGFTYNGYQYITAFSFLTLWILFTVYKKFGNVTKQLDLLIAPIFVWLIINYFMYLYLQGGAFFIIPTSIALLILTIDVFTHLEKNKKGILFTLLSIPTLYILIPLVKMFPVGLGLKNLYVCSLLIVLIFGLLTPIFQKTKATNKLKKIVGFVTIVFFGLATYNSGFSIDNKKPNSLVYIQDSDKKTAFFVSYNKTLDSYTEQIFGKNPTKGNMENAQTKSKYNTHYNFIKKTNYKNISSSLIKLQKDTIINLERQISITITPQRKVNKIELLTETAITFNQLNVNGVFMNQQKGYTVKKGTFLVYQLGNNDTEINLSFSINKDINPLFIINEISYDLLSNPAFNLQPRTEKMMPMPFVTNDAIICTKKITL